MQIVANLVRLRQEWDPDTNEHVNSVVFEFAGVIVEVPVSPEEVKRIITEAQAQRTQHRPEAPLSSDLEAALSDELTHEEEETVFGGDYAEDVPVEAPALFQAQGVSLEEALDAASPPAPEPSPRRLTETEQRQAAMAARRAADPAQRRKEEKKVMRERAARIPRRKVEMDEDGYPIVRRDSPVSVVGKPEIVRRPPPGGAQAEGDDDGFAQG